jgi:hypothetical protein
LKVFCSRSPELKKKQKRAIKTEDLWALIFVGPIYRVWLARSIWKSYVEIHTLAALARAFSGWGLQRASLFATGCAVTY